ncbi:MAG: COQ9 family protein [Kiloniellales bacterium]
MDMDKARERILFATLPHVPIHGWSLTALGAGTRDAGFEPVMAERAFPGGPTELVEAFSAWADRAALKALERHDLAAMKVRDRVATGVWLRLEAMAPHRAAVRQGLGFLALPASVGLGLRLLYRTVDALWYAAGDTATDYNFYTKRALLAAVYGSTLLCWLNDRSEGFADTKGFLDRRIAEVMQVPKATARLRKLTESLPSPLKLLGAFRAAGRRRGGTRSPRVGR